MPLSSSVKYQGDKTMSHYSKIKLPKICARCGSEHIVDNWEMETIKNTYDISTLLNMLIGRIKVQKNKYSFSVPVCFTCKESLQKTTNVTSAIPIIFIAGGVIAFSVEVGFILGLFGGLLGYLLSLVVIPIIKNATNSKIGDYDGEYFSFRNKEFMKVFASYNPSYIKK